MFEELNAHLAIAKENLRQKQKFERLIKQSEESLQQMTAEKSELDNTLQKEDRDVHKLETISVTGLFYTILGSKEQQLEKEQQELLTARLKYEACCASTVQLEKEIASFQAHLAKLTNAEAEYDAALKNKETAILNSSTANASVLSKLMDQYADLHSQKKELAEAVTAGDIVADELQKAISSLVSAEGWGTWDMFGGGFLATSMKHSRIDEARGYAQNATNALSRFEKELSDVNQNISLDINIGSFSTFADYFFDGLISDWIVQSKLEESSAAIRRVSETTCSVLHSLNEQMGDLKQRLNSVSAELLTTIENA